MPEALTQDEINAKFKRCQERELPWFETGPTILADVVATVSINGQEGWRLSKVLSGNRVLFTREPIRMSVEAPHV